MRIAIVTWSKWKVGGTEAYLESVIPELLHAGHEVAFWHESDVPTNDQIALPDNVPSWCVSEMGARKALTALRAWRPDVIYAHSLMQPKLEAEMLKVAPAVFFAHAYYGTCISGGKTFKRPRPTPCHRRFGWQCMAHYYPHRCGGLSPLTMLKEYRRQARRLEHYQSTKPSLPIDLMPPIFKHGFAPSGSLFSYYAHDVGMMKTMLLPQASGGISETSKTIAVPNEPEYCCGGCSFSVHGFCEAARPIDALPR